MFDGARRNLCEGVGVLDGFTRFRVKSGNGHLSVRVHYVPFPCVTPICLPYLAKCS